jgi:UPF0716 protein FxsA
MRLPLLLLLLPVVELWLMIEIGSQLGALAVIGWLLLMIVVGLNLLRYLGGTSMLRSAQSMGMGMGKEGELPAQALADKLFKAVGAVLLIIPGFLTDFIALLCFIPWFRRLLLKRWLAKMAANAAVTGFYSAGFQPGQFQRDPFGAGRGNVYEHQGPVEVEPESTQGGVLSDQSAAENPADSAKKP